jgi:hypothetical protein
MSEPVKKYKCPKCSAIVTNQMSTCPKCGKKFSWSMTKATPRKDETSDFLLKWQYALRTANFIFPWASLLLLFKNKDYATCINSSKVKCYDGFKNHTIIACAIHGILIFGILVYGLTMIKGASGA